MFSRRDQQHQLGAATPQQYGADCSITPEEWRSAPGSACGIATTQSRTTHCARSRRYSIAARVLSHPSLSRPRSSRSPSRRSNMHSTVVVRWLSTRCVQHHPLCSSQLCPICRPNPSQSLISSTTLLSALRDNFPEQQRAMRCWSVQPCGQLSGCTGTMHTECTALATPRHGNLICLRLPTGRCVCGCTAV